MIHSIFDSTMLYPKYSVSKTTTCWRTYFCKVWANQILTRKLRIVNQGNFLLQNIKHFSRSSVIFRKGYPLFKYWNTRKDFFAAGAKLRGKFYAKSKPTEYVRTIQFLSKKQVVDQGSVTLPFTDQTWE